MRPRKCTKDRNMITVNLLEDAMLVKARWMPACAKTWFSGVTTNTSLPSSHSTVNSHILQDECHTGTLHTICVERYVILPAIYGITNTVQVQISSRKKTLLPFPSTSNTDMQTTHYSNRARTEDCTDQDASSISDDIAQLRGSEISGAQRQELHRHNDYGRYGWTQAWRICCVRSMS